MKLTDSDKEYLKQFGNHDDDMDQIEEATRKTIYKLSTGEKISSERAIELLGREVYLSGIQRSAFHYTAARKVNDSNLIVFFDSSRLFKPNARKKPLSLQLEAATSRSDQQKNTTEREPNR